MRSEKEYHDEYWTVVRDCLREFHGMAAVAAQRKAKRLRNEIETLSEIAVELFYHDEPWYVACDLAGRDLNIDPFVERYLYLRDTKHGFVYPPQPAPAQPPRAAASRATSAPGAKSVRRDPAKA